MASATSNASGNANSWRPKAIIFDLLTALLDSWSLWDASIPTSMATSPGEAASLGRTWRKRYLQLTFGAGSYVPYSDLVHRSAQDVGLPASAPSALLANWDNLQAWPETASVLRRLRAKGYKLATVTNCSTELGHRAARRAVTEGEWQWDAVVTAEEVGFYKPRPETYEAALKAAGVKKEEALFVAGSAGDVEGATSVGMRVVWHNQVGLDRLGDAVPLREGKSLEEVLEGWL